jgi:hypothetical protein
MSAPAGDLTDTRVEQAELETLAAQVTALGFVAQLYTPDARLPYLEVRNPQVSALSERVYAQAGAYWFSWAQKISDTDDPADAARRLARVLATADATPAS